MFLLDSQNPFSLQKIEDILDALYGIAYTTCLFDFVLILFACFEAADDY